MHKIKETLIRLGISTEKSIVPFYDKLRGQEDVGGGISVLTCKRSGVIFLSRTDHLGDEYYNNKLYNGRGAQSREEAIKATAEDAERRCKQLRKVIVGKKWLDVGTGSGGVLDLLGPYAKEVVAVEPQQKARESLLALGYTAYQNLNEVEREDFGVVTLFHVYEHMSDPVSELETVYAKMKKGGRLIIEVPHARDFLISFLEHGKFKEFTFWVEHLILHTRESLGAFIAEAGFSDIAIQGFQRYPLSNHLYWLAKGKQGGHTEWPMLQDEELDASYAKMLAGIDRTDTLIAYAKK